MTDNSLPTHIAGAGDPMHAMCVELTERMRAAAVNSTGLDMPEEMAMIMTAAAMLSGVIYGSMVGVGIETDTRPKRIRAVSDMVVRNFRSGVDVAVRAAARIECDMAGGIQ